MDSVKRILTRGRNTKVLPIQDEFEGPLENRSCRDVTVLIYFLLYLCGMVYVAYLGISTGNPYRLVYGHDSFGNVCNQPNEKIEGAVYSGLDMSNKPKTFFFDPAYFSSLLPKSPISKVTEDETTVICIQKCPDMNETLLRGKHVNDYMEETGINLCVYNETKYISDTDRCPSLPITRQVSLFNRCIPELVKKTAEEMAKTFTSVLSRVTMGTTITQKILSDLKNTWKEILALGGVSIGVALLVLILLRYLAGVIVWTLVLMVVGLSLGATSYSWYRWNKEKQLLEEIPEDNRTEEAEQRVRSWLTFACIASGASVILLLILLVMRNRIGLVVQLFKEAGSALGSMPLLLLQPIWTIIFLFGIVTSLLTISVFIETSGKTVVNEENDRVKLEFEGYWNYVRWYHIFGMLWISAFIVACQEVVIAGAVATWYFTRDKSKLGSPILTSVKRLLRYHLGSVAFGSFIIAVVRFARAILAYVQKKLKGKTSKVVDFLLKMLQCCLWCFEKFLKFLNRNAYIEIAIYGYSFCEAARKAFTLIVNNALRVAAINSIGTFVLVLAKISIVAIVLIIGNEFLKDRSDINYAAVPITIGCAFAFGVAHCFILVYEMTIDTIFLCFCEDCERNDGSKKPFFMSTNLMKYINDSKKEEAQRMSIKGGETSKL